ncbi:MAG: VOC family protein [Candidatus Hodarchaeota archaeon]
MTLERMKLEPMIYTTNIEIAITFYRDTLGFEIDEYYPNEDHPTWVCVRIGNDRFGIGKTFSDIKYKLHPRGVDGSGVQFYIRVTNVDNIYEKYRNKVEIIDDIEDKPWGDREFTFKDPDGYLISFFTRISDLKRRPSNSRGN